MRQVYFVSVVRFSSDRFVADFCEWFKASSCYTWVLTKILVFARYHSDDDRVRLSVKDFWAISVLSGAFSYRKKSNSVWMLIANGTRFSLFWSPSFDSQTFCLIVCFLRRCNNKNTRNRVKPHLKKGRKGQKRGVLGKSQFCPEKKNRKIKEEKRSRSATHEIWLSCAWCVSNIGLNFQKTFI